MPFRALPRLLTPSHAFSRLLAPSQVRLGAHAEHLDRRPDLSDAAAAAAAASGAAATVLRKQSFGGSVGGAADSELERVRQLGQRRVSAAEITELLRSSKLLETLGELLAEAARGFSRQRTATAHELHENVIAGPHGDPYVLWRPQ